MFENPQIDQDSLPALADVDWQPMHPSLRKQMLLKSTLTLGIIAAAALAAHWIGGVTLSPPWMQIPVFAIVAATFLGWPFISVPRRGYALRKHDIAYKSGVLVKTITTIPFDRIQHVETSRGPLDRRYGTSTLKLFTAGGSKGDLDIDGMDMDVAEHVRGFILNRIDAGSR
ncbi:MAG: PH domain-containing protein [Woeseiaceae bacterium]|nr:PH domain-containing protein [Woeseiaceae bacterium]